VPSLFHSSTPFVPSSAVKNRVPFTFVRFVGYEPVAPGRMSLIRTVPAGVPSLLQSSQPVVPSLAAKNSVPFTSVRDSNLPVELPALMSLTRVVPPSVPSLLHNSRPCVPSLATKNSVPLTLVSCSGFELFGTYHQLPYESYWRCIPGKISLTIMVPPVVP